MKTRQLGYSDLHLTTIGLGAWAIGGDWAYGWGPQDDADSIRTIRQALDLGINWIDTAAAYGLGHSERIVGEAIAGRRDQVTVATKCGIVWEGHEAEPEMHLKANSVRREAEASLRRLGVEAIDLYQIHWPIPDEDIEEAWGVIADLIREGKVRYGGVSNCSVSQLQRVQPIHPVASLQPPYGMLVRGVEQELLAYCAANAIGVVAYSPMQAGLLTGKMTRERFARLASTDWRRTNDHFTEPAFGANLALVDGLRPIAERHGKTVAELAIAWVLRRPEVTAAIVGARHPAQVEETVGAGDWTLSPEVVDEIDALLAIREQAMV